MIVFAVSALAPNAALDAALPAKFPGNCLQASPTLWLVASGGTAQEVSDKIGITEGGLGSTIVFSTAGYYGRAPSNIWEWIKAKLEAPLDA
jgi:hypothetical protein